MEQFIKANLLKADLLEIDKQLSQGFECNMKTLLLVKQAFLTVANLYDFEVTIKPIYRDFRELSAKYKEHLKQYTFSKYLRNKFVGHIKPELITKAIEWKPELRYSLNRVGEPEIMFIFNLFILETAINTYVDKDGGHQLFNTETDLVYPPDFDRFMKFLTITIRSAIEYLEQLSNALGESVEKLTPQEQKLDHWKKAGQTQFEFIRK
jgi:hypothetical protein